MEPVRRRTYTPQKQDVVNDAFAMCVCRTCGTVVTPIESTLPCPGCGGLSYRKVPASSVTAKPQNDC